MKLGRRLSRITAAIILGSFGPGAAAVVLPIEVQVQTQYQVLETKPAGEPVKSNGSFTTTYNLGFRRPLTPRAKLQSFFTLNSSDRSDQVGEQSNKNMVFNLISQERTYSLTGGIDRSDHSSASSLSGISGFTSGSTTNYHANFMWQEPAMPTVNLQYRKSTSDVSSNLSSSTYSTGTWLTGAYYEYSPLRFTFDRQQQEYNFSGQSNSSTSKTVRNRHGVNFEQRLLEGLNFSADFNKDLNSTNGTNTSSDLDGTSSTFRLTAIPTRSVVLSADRSHYRTHYTSRSLINDSDSDTTTLALRSEILPGLSLGVTQTSGNQASDLVTSKNNNLSVSLGAALTRDTTATLGFNKTDYRTMPENTFAKQKSTFMSLRTPLGFDTDVNIDFGLTDSDSGSQLGYKGKYAGINLRNRSTMDMSLGLGYRWNILDLLGAAGGIQRTQSLDMDLAWTPASTLGINARASYYVTSGTTISQYLAPTLDVRWESSRQSSLVFRYNFNRSEQWDSLLADILGQSSKGLSARFSYRLSPKSSLDLTYDFQAVGGSSIEFQRALRAYFRTKL